jgi:hypothetical protein
VRGFFAIVQPNNGLNMKQINKEEMFQNLKGFLKSKGIELQEGAYTQQIQSGCDILTDTVNLSQATLERAKAAVNKSLNQFRQAVHERTAPRRPTANAKTGGEAKPTGSRGTKKKNPKSAGSKARTNPRNRRAKRQP